MNDRTAKRIRGAVSLRGSGPAIYVGPEIHHLAEAPVYIKHTRVLRTWDPKTRKIISRTVEKTRYRADGKTPLGMKLRTVTKDGKVEVLPETTLLSVAKPIRLKKGTPKALYRLMKRLESTVGIDNIYKAVIDAEVANAPAA
jgi:hypothetical protein